MNTYKTSKDKTVGIYLLVAAIILSATYLFFWSGKGFHEIYTVMTYTEPFSAYVNPDQYAYLGDALLHGHLYLDLPVPDALVNLENPYSPEDRATIANGGANPIFFDHAFYNGKYYCYFGVIPAILLYIPYQIATGSWLNTAYAVAFLGVLSIFSLTYLAFSLSKRFSKTITPASSLLVLVTLFLGSGVMCLGSIPRFYEVPMLMSISFTCIGISLWLTAKSTIDTKTVLKPARLFFGTLFIVMNLGCRPQFTLTCILAIPLFWNEIFKERELLSKKGLKNTFLALLPIIIIVPPLLLYNYARFDSPFNFGANYNLTTFDMTSYQQNWFLTLHLLKCALIKLPDLMRQPPFIRIIDTSYPSIKDAFPDAWAPIEPMFGGFIWVVCVTWLIFLIPLLWKNIKRHQLLGFCGCAFLICAAIILVDIRVAGISQRYFSDYGIILMMQVCIVILTMQERFYNANGRELEQSDRPINWRIFVGFTFILLAISAFFTFSSLLSPSQFDSYSGLGADWFINLFNITRS